MALRRSFLWFFVLILVVTGSVSAQSPAQDLAWEQIAPGIEYQKFRLPDPNNIFVVRMDRANPTVTLETTIAQGKLSEGRETVSGMYARYDQALNYWGGNANPPTWGMRNQAVVAINGSYIVPGTDIPQGGQIQSGWYAKRYENSGGWSGFAWKLDRSVLYGECVYHIAEKQFITYPSTNKQEISGVNRLRGSDELVIYTPQYNTRTGTDNSGVEVLVEMLRPTMILPAPNSARGIVRQIRNAEGNSVIRFNSIVLSATGEAAATLLANVSIDSEIGVSQEITSCPGYDPIDWTKTYTSIQGAFPYLKNGQIREFNDDPGATNRNPRTAIAFNDQYVFFVVVDGRDIQHSVGMTINELALFTRDQLGATSGVAQDGGGSSTMVINGLVVNNTFCNIYTCMATHSTYIPFVMRNSNMGQPGVVNEDDVISSPAGIERPIANGMLMVVTQPGEYSQAFLPADPVTTLIDTDVRVGPGTNYASFTAVPNGSNGSIVDQMNGLDGVLAKGIYWWYVDFGFVTGWVAEGALAHQAVNIVPPARYIDR